MGLDQFLWKSSKSTSQILHCSVPPQCFSGSFDALSVRVESWASSEPEISTGIYIGGFRGVCLPQIVVSSYY